MPDKPPLDDSGAYCENLPHPLLCTLKELESALDKGIGQFERTFHVSNTDDVCCAMARFVDEFCRVPAWEAELRQRAGFVGERCAQGSEFRHPP